MNAMNSLSTTFVPSRLPAVAASAQGMPSSQATGAMTTPSMRSRVSGAPATSGRTASRMLASLTRATKTSSVARMLQKRRRPSAVPETTASMGPEAAESGSLRPSVGSLVSGSMSAATTSAAGAWMTEAVRMCPRLSGNTALSAEA